MSKELFSPRFQTHIEHKRSSGYLQDLGPHTADQDLRERDVLSITPEVLVPISSPANYHSVSVSSKILGMDSILRWIGTIIDQVAKGNISAARFVMTSLPPSILKLETASNNQFCEH